MILTRRNLRSLLGFLLAAGILLGFFLPTTAGAVNTYRFLNPLGTVEPRQDTPLADRQGVIDILNGTGEKIGLTDVFTLFNEDSGEEIPVNNSPYTFSLDVYPNGTREFTAELNGFLEPGKYRIEAEGYSATFEIS